MSPGARRIALGAVATVLLLGAAKAPASPQAQAPDARPTFRTEANFVRVDVYPTRNGTAVTDLRAQDFEILEDKVPQKIDAFAHVLVRSGGPQDARREPNTVAESLQETQNPRARVFVLFLDINHVELAASRAIRKPLVEAIDRLLGPDDLIAVMTPEMSPRDITFARRTTTIDGVLDKYWWGERDRTNFIDPTDNEYAACYPGIPQAGAATAPDQGIAQEMILRRREKQTLDSLQDLVRYLGGVREERKAIVTITDGWRLYTPNAALDRPIDGQAPPGGPSIGIDPRNGQPTNRLPTLNGANRNDCERDRFALSQLDDQRLFHDILDDANRSNSSFYPIDPRGLAVFDEDIVPAAGVGVGPGANPMVGLVADQARLTERHNSVRTLADATDGVAVVDSNDLARGLRRIVDDLTSYYLLGYYSSGKLDGKFHAITVRVKQPGVQVRARRGYLANTEANTTAISARSAPPTPAAAAAAAEARIVDTAIGSLDNFARERPAWLHAAAGWAPSGAATVWLVFEPGHSANADDWTGGGQADAVLVDAAGRTVASERATLAPGAQSARLALPVGRALSGAPITSGDYEVQIRSKAARGGIAANDTLKITVPASPQATGAVFFRQGPSTANRAVPTADVRFRRSDRLRLEVPSSANDAVTARLLDRTGKVLPIPVTASVRDDADGSRWRVADVVLAPLAPGDYLIEMTAGAERLLQPFRVVP